MRNVVFIAMGTATKDAAIGLTVRAQAVVSRFVNVFPMARL